MMRKRVNPLTLSALIAASALATSMVLGQLIGSVRISNTGTVKGVGVGAYWDNACLNATSSIDWGLLEPGEKKTVLLYIQNKGNANVTLSLNATNWKPQTIAGYLTLAWDYGGQTLIPNQAILVNLTLSVSSAVQSIDNFTFDIIINATA